MPKEMVSISSKGRENTLDVFFKNTFEIFLGGVGLVSHKVRGEDYDD